MARPILYRVDPDQLLRRIFELTVLRRQELDQQIKTLQAAYDRDNFSLIQELHRERLLSDWTPYSAETLAGEALSDGRRRAVTRTVLELEQDGYVRGDGRRLAWIQLTKQGVERVEKKQAAAE